MNLWSLLISKAIITKWKTVLSKILILLSLSKWVEICGIEELRHVLLLLLLLLWHWHLILMLSTWTTSRVASLLTLTVNRWHVICIFFFFSIVWSTSFFRWFSLLFALTLLSWASDAISTCSMNICESRMSIWVQIRITFIAQVSATSLRHYFSFSSNDRSGCWLTQLRIINWKSFLRRSLMSSVLTVSLFQDVNLTTR